jgi:hypothetical protein
MVGVGCSGSFRVHLESSHSITGEGIPRAKVYASVAPETLKNNNLDDPNVSNKVGGKT